MDTIFEHGKQPLIESCTSCLSSTLSRGCHHGSQASPGQPGARLARATSPLADVAPCHVTRRLALVAQQPACLQSVVPLARMISWSTQRYRRRLGESWLCDRLLDTSRRPERVSLQSSGGRVGVIINILRYFQHFQHFQHFQLA